MQPGSLTPATIRCDVKRSWIMRRIFALLLLALPIAAPGQTTGEIDSVTMNGPTVALSWTPDAATAYRVERAQGITNTAWSSLLTLWPNGTNGAFRESVSNSTVFYRLVSLTNKLAGGERMITFVPHPAGGNMVVEIVTPRFPRYTNSAGVVLTVSTWIIGNDNFTGDAAFEDVGLLHLRHLFPGNSDSVGVRSDGEIDYGGTNSIAGLAAVVRFALGMTPDLNGHYLHDLVEVEPLYNNVGLNTFSHPGIAAANVLATHGATFSNRVAYLIGGENPTCPALVTKEAGSSDTGAGIVSNRAYAYPAGYATNRLLIDYDLVRWTTNFAGEQSAYFDINSNGVADAGSDYLMGQGIPSLGGKRYYSPDLCRALTNNGIFTLATWPTNFANPLESETFWSIRNAPDRYAQVGAACTNLKVLLHFAYEDHSQGAADKPHVHQAYDGYRTAGLWTRLNPDRAYANSLSSSFGAVSPDNAANTQPADWNTALSWSYTNTSFAAAYYYAVLTCAAEMSDRTWVTNWSPNLAVPLVVYTNGP